MFLLSNQGRNQANKTFTTNLQNGLSASFRFLIYRAHVLIILLLLFLYKTAEKIISSMWIFKMKLFYPVIFAFASKTLQLLFVRRLW